MKTEFCLPDLGEGVTSGTLLQVTVEAGATVRQGDAVAEVESDKATAEIPIDADGTVAEIRVKAGDTVEPGDVLLVLERTETTEASGAAETPTAPQQEAATATAPAEEQEEAAAQEVPLPALGENMEEGDIVSLAVAVGDTVAAGDPLCEIETGKATLEVPAEADGTIESVHVNVGDRVKVGAALVTLKPAGTSTGRTPVPPAAAESGVRPPEDGQEATPRDETALQAGFVMASPSIRRLARELGVNIHAVPGSAPGGRISAADVKAFARRLITTGGGRPHERATFRGEGAGLDDFGPVRHEALGAVRRATARHMERSWQTIPHVTHFAEADLSALQKARADLAGRGEKVSVSALLLKVLAAGLKAHPRLNATLDMDREEIVLKEYIHIGVAVDTPRGLVVPVVRHVDRKPLAAVAAELKTLAGAAREGKVKASDLEGGTFTLSNLGPLGTAWFTPLVNAPQVAILGVGAARTQPVWTEAGEVKGKPLCPLSLSYDHRALDGADAARFFQWLTATLANPLLLLTNGD